MVMGPVVAALRVWCGLVLAACTASAPPAGDAAAAVPAAVVLPESVAAPEPVLAPAPSVAPTPERPELLALAAARLRFRAHDHAGAWALLEPIVQTVQSDGGLLCEAGYLAHHAGRGARAEALLRQGIAALSRDNTRPGRNSRAMCLYNLALVHEAGGALGEAICALRRSEALRTNGTVTRRRKALEATVKATNFRCQTGRVARQKDVRALASEYGAANKLEVTSLDRRDAGEFVVHTVHLDPGERDDGDVEVFADVQYVVLDRQGQLFPLGVLGYDDRTVTYFRSSASFRFAGSHPSRLGTLVLFSLESWGRGDCEHVESSNEISSSDHSELLVCRFVAAPEGGDVACAQVPLGAQEHADALDFADDGPGGGTGASGESSSGGARARVTEWGARVAYTLDEAAGAFVFTLDSGAEETAAALDLPVGRIEIDELFERYAAENVGLGL
jgi:hypothetical protein